MFYMLKANLLAVCFLLSISSIIGQGTIRGIVTDEDTGESLIGASIVVKGTTIGTVANIDGEFELEVDQNPPILLVVNFLGYSPKEVTVNSFDERLKIRLGTDNVLMQEVEIVGSRINEKTKQSALTVESMDVIAIK